MCFIFPCVMKKPAFATSDEPIDKLNLFFLSGRTVSRCRRQRTEKLVPTDRKKKITNSNYLRKQTFKSRIIQIKLCGVSRSATISLHFETLHIFF